MSDGTLRLRTGPGLSGDIAAYVRELAELGGLSARQAYKLRLAADEITTNIAMHGYACAGGVVDIDGGVEPDRVWLRIEDDAPKFDPNSEQRGAPALFDPLSSRVGGFGLALARASLDVFEYDYVDGRNRNTLVKWRSMSGAVATGGGDDAVDERTGDR